VFPQGETKGAWHFGESAMGPVEALAQQAEHTLLDFIMKSHTVAAQCLKGIPPVADPQRLTAAEEKTRILFANVRHAAEATEARIRERATAL